MREIVWTAVLCVLPLAAVHAEDGAPYAKYDRLLKTYVDDAGRVDYRAFKKEGEAELRAVVDDLGKLDPKAMSPVERKAYWINVYNAVTLKAMLEFYPLKSIKDKVTARFDVWKDYPFGPSKISLNAIEHQRLRPMGDPRIHAAIVCASKGCPILLNEAYVPGRLSEQLDRNVRKWLKDPKRGMKLQGDTVWLSEIFNWFGADFAKTEAGRLGWIAKFSPPEIATKLRAGGLRVKFLPWDWALNAQ